MDTGLRLLNELAAGLAVTERVEQIGVADDAAVAHDHVSCDAPHGDPVRLRLGTGGAHDGAVLAAA